MYTFDEKKVYKYTRNDVNTYEWKGTTLDGLKTQIKYPSSLRCSANYLYIGSGNLGLFRIRKDDLSGEAVKMSEDGFKCLSIVNF